MQTVLSRKADPVRVEMTRHRGVVEQYEKDAAGVEEDSDKAPIGVAVALALVLSGVLWIVMFLLYQWVRS